MTKLLVPVLAGLWLAALATSASATTTRYWDNDAGDGQWTNATNWSNNTAPASNTWAAFDSTSVANCTVGATAVTARLTFADTYTGTIILTNSLPNSGTVVVTNTGSWTLQGNATTINGSSCTFDGAGGTMNVTENATIPDTTFSANYTINVSSGKTLTINGDLTTYTNSAVLTLSGQGNVNVTNVTMGGTDNRINLSGGGKLNVSGSLTITNNDSLIIDGTGTIDVTGNVTDTSAEALSFTAGSTATLKIGGTMSTDFIFTKSVGCTVEFSGAGQTIPAYNYHHLKLSGSGTPALAGATDVAGTLTVGPTLNLNGQTLTLSGGLLAGAGTISNGTGTGTIAGATTVINGATPTITSASGNVTCSGAWTVGQAGGAASSLTLTTSVNALNFSSTLAVTAADDTLYLGGSGTATVASNVTKTGAIAFGSTGTLQIGGSFTGAGTLTEGTGTIEYNANGDQTILTETYGSLKISGTGTKSPNSGNTVAGTLTVDGALNLAGQTLALTGGFLAGSGTISNASGTGTISSAVTVKDGATPTITSASGAVTCSGAWTVGQGTTGTLSLTTSANALNFSSTLAVATGGTLNVNGTGTATVASNVTKTGALAFGSTGTLQIAGSFTGAGTLTEGTGTIEYNANGDQTILTETYGSLKISGTGTKSPNGGNTVGGTLTVDGALNLAGQTLALTGGFLAGSGTISNASGTGTISSAVTVKDGATPTITTASGAITCSGAWTVGQGTTGTLSLTTSANALNFSSTLAVATGGTLNINGANTVAVTGVVTKTGAITFGSTGTLQLGATGACFTGAGTLTEGTGTIEYNRNGDQTILAETYNNLKLSTGGTKSLGGTVGVGGTLTVDRPLDVVAQTLNVTSTGAVDGASNFTATGAGTINLASASVTPSFASMNAGSTVDYNRSDGNQSIRAATYGILKVSGGNDRVKSLTGATTLQGALTVAASTVLDMAGQTLNLPADPSIAGSGTLRSGSGTGIVLPSSGTTTISGGATIGGAGTTQFSSPVTVSGSTSTLAGDVTITGALSVASTLDVATYTLNLGADPTISGGGTIKNGSGAGTGYIVPSSGTTTLQGMTVGGTGTTRISSPVTVNTGTTTLGGNVTITGALSVASTLDVATYTLNLGADPTISGGGTIKNGSGAGTGTITPSSGTVTLQAMTIGAAGGITEFSSPVTVNSGTTTLAGAMTVAGSTLTVDSTLDLAGKTLTMSNGTTRDLAGSGTISNSTLTGTISGAITVKDGAGPGITTATGAITCSGAWTVGQGTSGSLTLTTSANALNFSSTLSVAANGTLYLAGTGSATIGGNLTGAGAVEFQAAATLTLEADFTNSGTFTQGDGTVKYAGGAAQTIRSGAEITYKHLQLSNSYDTYPNITVSGTAKVAGTLTVSQVTETTGGGTIESSGPSLVFNAAYTTDAGSTVAFKLSDDAAQTISGTDAPVFKDLELVNTYVNGSNPNVIYSNDGATLQVTGELKISAPTILQANSKTIDVDTVAVNANYTQTSGTFQMDSGDQMTVDNGMTVNYATGATFKSSGGTKPIITAADGETYAFQAYGTVNVDGLDFRRADTNGLQLGDGTNIPTITAFQNVDFSTMPDNGRFLTVKINTNGAFSRDIRGCTFGALSTGGANVKAQDTDLADSDYVYLRFEDRGTNGAGAGEANDDDNDSDSDGDIAEEATKGTVIEWLYTANGTIGGASGSGGITGPPTRAFGTDIYDFYSTYVVVKDYDNGGAAAADRILITTAADAGTGDNYNTLDIPGDIVGGIWWDTWDEATDGIPDLDNDGTQTDKHHVVLLGANEGGTGKIYVLIDNASSLALPTSSDWTSPLSLPASIVPTTMIANDGTNLYFAGVDGGSPNIYKVVIIGRAVSSLPLNVQGNATLASETVGSNTILYGGTIANGTPQSYLYRVDGTGWSVTNSWSQTDTPAADDFKTSITGHINVFGDYIFAGEVYNNPNGGFVQCVKKDFTANASGYPHISATPGTVGRIAVYTGTAYWGQDNGYAIKYNGTDDEISSAQLDASSPNKAISAAPIYRSSTGKVYIANQNGKLYRLLGSDMSVDHVYDFGPNISFTDVARDSGNNRIIVSGYDSLTDRAAFYSVVP